MKIVLLAAALAFGGTAIAQDQPAPDTAMPEMTAPDAAAQLPPPPPPAPGSTVVFQPSVPVAQAYPPPAPKAEYPWCKRGVTDGCKQRHDPGNGKSPQ